MLILGELVIVDLKLVAEVTPEFFNGVAFVFHGLQQPLHLLVVGQRPLNRRRLCCILMVLPDGADDPVQIAVYVMEKVFFLVNTSCIQDL